ncbi:MAG: ABC transporter permease [Steroidobacteraceae bacterium]
MRGLAQVLIITALSLRSVPRRLGNSLVIIVGIAGVVAVLLCVLTMYVNFRRTIDADGSSNRAIVVSRSGATESESGLSREHIADVIDAAGIRHDVHDRPLVSAEVILSAPVARKRDNSDVNVTLRGVGEQYFAVRPELKLVSGRMVHPGTQELLAGEAARRQFSGLEIGNQVRLQGGDWTVVGTFAGGHGSRESEVIADVRTLMAAYKLDSANTLTVVLESAAALPRLASALAARPALSVEARSEPEYLAADDDPTNRMLRLVAYAIGSIMAAGAFFSALNSVHSAVASRTVEIATLRAIGFTAGAVVMSILIESLLLALIGAAIGVAIAFTAFNGAVISTLGGAEFDSQLVYALVITPTLVATAVLLACALGILGGLFPALGAARANVAEALHET